MDGEFAGRTKLIASSFINTHDGNIVEIARNVTLDDTLPTWLSGIDCVDTLYGIQTC